ncbi:hypothetical protein SASPL_138294 [Salvia splendens]|uniref:FAD-binding domain-containing protein n=1 Tax=Salvia splendens TaxID=180675 RepID=A0A8X8WV50_SALSN|nr:hypothetical protein SASPL_138294 [Salvia splendens]
MFDSLATSLGLLRLGYSSVVLESADSLRTSGSALGIWANGWRELDAIGVGHIILAKHTKLSGPLSLERELVEDPAKVKQLVLSKLGKVSDKIMGVFEETELENMVCAPLRFRYPWEMLWGNISRDNICVIGDALHPMTPDMAKGGCSALEDSVILVRLLARVLKRNDEGNEQHAITGALEKLARERRWRCFDLISTSYIVGYIQQNDGVLLQFLRDNFLASVEV